MQMHGISQRVDFLNRFEDHALVGCNTMAVDFETGEYLYDIKNKESTELFKDMILQKEQ